MESGEENVRSLGKKNFNGIFPANCESFYEEFYQILE
jgi:hypothetical protein